MMMLNLALLTFLCSLMSIQGNRSVLKRIFYDYHYDPGFDNDFHLVKRGNVDDVKSRFRLNDNENFNIKSHSVSVINRIEQSNDEIQCEKQFGDTLENDDYYFENMIFHQNYFSKSYLSEKNTLEEILTRTQRDALYDPTIKTNRVNDFNFKYYPNGFHYFGKIHHTYEFPKYIHRCYYGDLTVVCVLIGDENDKYDIANHKLDYISENKLRWFFT